MGSSPQDDRPRSNGLPPDQAMKTNQGSSRIRLVSTCAKEQNTRLIPQTMQTHQATSVRQDHTRALRPAMHLHLFAQCMHAFEHMLLIHPPSLQTSPLTMTPLSCTAAAVSTCAVAGGYAQMIMSRCAKTSSSVSRMSVMCSRHTS